MPIESLFSELGEPRDDPWCLTFCNTVSSRHHPQSRDRFQTVEDLRAWLVRYEILDEDAPTAGEDLRNLERAIRLREAIFGIGAALAGRREPDPEDVSELNWNVQKAIVAAKLESEDTSLAWSLGNQRLSVAGSLGLLALSAAGLFTSARADRVRECSNDECGWLFLDISKNRSRKWCDMSDCGNVAKARRYYAKKKAEREPAIKD
jgi:predicted RNA-binding Zn ribbon-like protein